MRQPRVFNYMDYSSNNYGSSRAVEIGNLTLYFSYDTVIAVQTNKEFFIRKNDWSVTTGKHLNAINSDKKIRIDGEKFQDKLNKVLESYKLLEMGVEI